MTLGGWLVKSNTMVLPSVVSVVVFSVREKLGCLFLRFEKACVWFSLSFWLLASSVVISPLFSAWFICCRIFFLSFDISDLFASQMRQ